MRPKDLKLIIILPALAFIFCCLGADRICAQADSADVAINYKTAYPSSVVDVEVQLKNPMPINGLQFMITVSNSDLIDFHTDSVTVSSVLDTVWQDTCTGPEPHGDTCFIVDSVRVVDLLVRFCHIDTTGSPISEWNLVECCAVSLDRQVDRHSLTQSQG